MPMGAGVSHTDSSIASAVVHAGIICSGCGMAPLQGTRHKCCVCDDYDLCGDCHEMRGTLHPPEHAFRMDSGLPREVGTGDRTGQSSDAFYYCYCCETHFTMHSPPANRPVADTAICPICPDGGLVEENVRPSLEFTFNSEDVASQEHIPDAVNNFLQQLQVLHSAVNAGEQHGSRVPAPGGQEWWQSFENLLLGDMLLESQRIAAELAEENSQPTEQPAKPEKVAALPVLPMTTKKVSSEPLCAICLSHWQENEEALQLPCGHHYHASCVKKWLGAHNSCPLCRAAVSTPVPPALKGGEPRGSAQSRGDAADSVDSDDDGSDYPHAAAQMASLRHLFPGIRTPSGEHSSANPSSSSLSHHDWGNTAGPHGYAGFSPLASSADAALDFQQRELARDNDVMPRRQHSLGQTSHSEYQPPHRGSGLRSSLPGVASLPSISAVSPVRSELTSARRQRGGSSPSLPLPSSSPPPLQHEAAGAATPCADAPSLPRRDPPISRPPVATTMPPPVPEAPPSEHRRPRTGRRRRPSVARTDPGIVDVGTRDASQLTTLRREPRAGRRFRESYAAPELHVPFPPVLGRPVGTARLGHRPYDGRNAQRH